MKVRKEVDKFNDIRYYNEAGQFHRDDGPAIIYNDGEKHWYQNGVIHRDDGPALIFANGEKLWYKNGKLHRDNGPAVEHPNGFKEWYFDGKEYTQTEFKIFLAKKKVKNNKLKKYKRNKL